MRRLNKIFFVVAWPVLLSGCGMQGPLYLPPNPEDSYLSRIQKSLNEMTGTTTAVMVEPKDDAEVVVTDPEEIQENNSKLKEQKDPTLSDKKASEGIPGQEPTTLPKANSIYETESVPVK